MNVKESVNYKGNLLEVSLQYEHQTYDHPGGIYDFEIVMDGKDITDNYSDEEQEELIELAIEQHDSNNYYDEEGDEVESSAPVASRPMRNFRAYPRPEADPSKVMEIQYISKGAGGYHGQLIDREDEDGDYLDFGEPETESAKKLAKELSKKFKIGGKTLKEVFGQELETMMEEYVLIPALSELEHQIEAHEEQYSGADEEHVYKYGSTSKDIFRAILLRIYEDLNSVVDAMESKGKDKVFEFFGLDIKDDDGLWIEEGWIYEDFLDHLMNFMENQNVINSNKKKPADMSVNVGFNPRKADIKRLKDTIKEHGDPSGVLQQIIDQYEKEAGPVESKVTANLYEFVKDHVEHFGAMPMEYEDEKGNVHDYEDYLQMLSEEELQNLEEELKKSESGAEKLDHDSVMNYLRKHAEEHGIMPSDFQGMDFEEDIYPNLSEEEVAELYHIIKGDIEEDSELIDLAIKVTELAEDDPKLKDVTLDDFKAFIQDGFTAKDAQKFVDNL